MNVKTSYRNPSQQYLNSKCLTINNVDHLGPYGKAVNKNIQYSCK